MEKKVLKKKPLVEAIFEARWELQELAPGIRVDPHYKILLGRIYDRVKNEYPFHEQLPTATMPDQIAGYVVQHRFRKKKDRWPLIQVGPGIITLNDTEGYVWEDFEKRIYHVIDVLFQAYPEGDRNLKINLLLLRYIDSIDFDFSEEDIFSFLGENLKVKVEIYEKLFDKTGVSRFPLDFDLRFSFSSRKPKGAVHLRFVRGKRNNVEALIWETHVRSVGEDVPRARGKIAGWVTEAHTVTHDWFFKMIEGRLLRRFE